MYMDAKKIRDGNKRKTEVTEKFKNSMKLMAMEAITMNMALMILLLAMALIYVQDYYRAARWHKAVRYKHRRMWQAS